jgi:hypothetical protein
VNAVLGPERVFGYGRAGIDDDYAELVTHMTWSARDGWVPTQARVLDPGDPLGAQRGRAS